MNPDKLTWQSGRADKQCGKQVSIDFGCMLWLSRHKAEPKVQMGSLSAWEFACKRSDGTALNLTGTGTLPDIKNTVFAFL